MRTWLLSLEPQPLQVAGASGSLGQGSRVCRLIEALLTPSLLDGISGELSGWSAL